MTKTLISFRGAVVLAGLVLGFAGCSSGPEGDLPTPKPMTTEEADAVADQVKQGSTGYKGAPGIPLKGR